MSFTLRLLSFTSITKKKFMNIFNENQRIFNVSKICYQKLNRSFSSCDDMSKIGINGFGRIGRLVFRASIEFGAQVLNNLLIY